MRRKVSVPSLMRKVRRPFIAVEPQLTIPEKLMHATVRMECVGAGGVKSWGTGFFFKFLEDGKQHVPVIVTNKHVIEGAHTGAFWLTKKEDGRPQIGRHLKVEIANFASIWIGHPDPDVDLAVAPVASIIQQATQNGLNFYYVNLDETLLPTAEQIDSLSGFDDILMVGYPNALWDSVNNLPILRAGVTATHPKYNYEGKPMFLIDCACFPGSSGSPVLIFDKNGWTDRKGVHLGQQRLLLVGVLFAGPQHVAEGDVTQVEVPSLAHRVLALSKIPNNLGFVVKAEKLRDFDPILEARRRAV